MPRIVNEIPKSYAIRNTESKDLIKVIKKLFYLAKKNRNVLLKLKYFFLNSAMCMLIIFSFVSSKYSMVKNVLCNHWPTRQKLSWNAKLGKNNYNNKNILIRIRKLLP